MKHIVLQNMYFEGSNQPLVGKIAVSQVVNRTQHELPINICGVVYQAKWKETGRVI